MIALVAALVVAPWTHPLAFRAHAGWQTGASGTTRSAYAAPGPRAHVPLESTAWTARGVRYRDGATADPPNRTLRHLPARAVIVWAVIYAPAKAGQAPLRLALGKARRHDCCEGAFVRGGEYELTGSGPRGAYSAIVRIYFGSRPTRAARLQAQRALDRLPLPPPR